MCVFFCRNACANMRIIEQNVRIAFNTPISLCVLWGDYEDFLFIFCYTFTLVHCICVRISTHMCSLTHCWINAFNGSVSTMSIEISFICCFSCRCCCWPVNNETLIYQVAAVGTIISTKQMRTSVLSFDMFVRSSITCMFMVKNMHAGAHTPSMVCKYAWCVLVRARARTTTAEILVVKSDIDWNRWHAGHQWLGLLLVLVQTISFATVGHRVQPCWFALIWWMMWKKCNNNRLKCIFIVVELASY